MRNVHCSSQPYQQKAGAFVLRSVAKHTPDLASHVVKAGALPRLTRCLEKFDASVRESAAWAIGYIAAHNEGST